MLSALLVLAGVSWIRLKGEQLSCAFEQDLRLMTSMFSNHAHDSTTHNTAGSAYDKGATTHHAGAPVGTTQGTNTTGAAYGVPTGRSAIPGQEPYATR